MRRPKLKQSASKIPPWKFFFLTQKKLSFIPVAFTRDEVLRFLPTAQGDTVKEFEDKLGDREK